MRTTIFTKILREENEFNFCVFQSNHLFPVCPGEDFV